MATSRGTYRSVQGEPLTLQGRDMDLDQVAIFSWDQFWPLDIVACICAVCPSSGLSVNYELVCKKTDDLFMLGSPNLGLGMGQGVI